MYQATGDDELWKIGSLEILRLIRAYILRVTVGDKEELRLMLANKVPGQEFDAWLDDQEQIDFKYF